MMMMMIKKRVISLSVLLNLVSATEVRDSLSCYTCDDPDDPEDCVFDETACGGGEVPFPLHLA